MNMGAVAGAARWLKGRYRVIVAAAALGLGLVSCCVPAAHAADRSAPLTRADRLMQFGEICFPDLFATGPSTQSLPPFQYRFYPASGVYLGLVVDANMGYAVDDVYVMGGAFGGTPLRVGRASDFITDLPVEGFVAREGGRFVLEGQGFRIAGANAAQVIAHVDRSGADSALCNARLMGANVVRFFGASEIGSADGTVRTLGTNPAWRPYFQSWDPAAGRVVFNEGANGLQHLDHVVAVAKALGLRLVISLVDNWDEFFGGVNQYVLWYGRSGHGSFYTDPLLKQAYRDWVRNLLNRVNTRTGVRYGDEPTILGWTLVSEASCYGGTAFPAGTCQRQDIEAWAGEMSTYVKTLAPQHLVGLGDQGYFGARDDPAMGWPYRSTNEPDFETVLRLPAIDFGTYHLYPFDYPTGDGSLSPTAYGLRYIRDREAIARSVGKPAVLEEFGARDSGVQAAAFNTWLSALDSAGGTGFIFWGIGSRFANGSLEWDALGYTIFPDSPAAAVLKTWLVRFNPHGAAASSAPRRSMLPPANAAQAAARSRR